MMLGVGCSESRGVGSLDALPPAEDGASANVILVVLDGIRWQDFFDTDGAMRRRDEAPAFQAFWSDIAPHGAVFGDRTIGSRVRMTLAGSFSLRMSLPSYQSMLAGYGYPCADNDCRRIGVETFPEALRRRLELRREEVAVVASWRGIAQAVADPAAIHVDAGRTPDDRTTGPRPDVETFQRALAHLRAERPRFLMLVLDEADNRAHEGERLQYLETLRLYDRLLVRLFEVLDQMPPAYRDNTTVLLTTDHGRGSEPLGWRYHGVLWAAQDVFLAALGPHTRPLGRARSSRDLRHADIRPTVELLLGLEPVRCEHATCGRGIAELLQAR
jgi:hypothetical protein